MKNKAVNLARNMVHNVDTFGKLAKPYSEANDRVTSYFLLHVPRAYRQDSARGARST